MSSWAELKRNLVLTIEEHNKIKNLLGPIYWSSDPWFWMSVVEWAADITLPMSSWCQLSNEQLMSVGQWAADTSLPMSSWHQLANEQLTLAVPSHPSRTQFYSISDPIADLILIWNQTYIRPEILKNQTSRRIKDLLRLFLKYFPFTFNFEHSFWCIAIENHLLSSLTASILSQKNIYKANEIDYLDYALF